MLAVLVVVGTAFGLLGGGMAFTITCAGITWGRYPCFPFVAASKPG
jgi:hypothetical protein